MHLNASLHLSDVVLPPGVSSVDIVQGRDPSIVSIHGLRAEEPEPAAAVAATAADPKAAAAAPAAGKADAKKDAPKK
jgi:hypothetical protein